MTWVVRAPDRDLERAEKKLYSRVRRVLWDYEPLRASHAEIEIDVAGDVVELRGRVRTLPQKIIAQGLVERMSDVGSVVNHLIADPDVVRAVADALASDERTAAYVLRVEVRHGTVVLRGEVPSSSIGQTAVQIASSLPPVNGVRNQLVVGGEPRPAVSVARPSVEADVTDPAPLDGAPA